MSNRSATFLELLQLLLKETKECDEVKVKDIFGILAGKGYAALLILFSVPFSFFFQIPGSSLPFGILLSFIGLRVAFAKNLWWPDWIMEKRVKSNHLEYFVKKGIAVVQNLQTVLHPRLTVLTQNPIFHRMHGLVVFILALFLALPLPVPMTNVLSSWPILCIGLGLLEDDGVFIILGYCLAAISLVFWGILLIFGAEQIAKLSHF